MKMMIVSLLLCSSVVVAQAKNIELNVTSASQALQHLELIAGASARDTLEVMIADNITVRSSLLCRYVKALKDTKARVRIKQIPRLIIKLAKDC